MKNQFKTSAVAIPATPGDLKRACAEASHNAAQRAEIVYIETGYDCTVVRFFRRLTPTKFERLTCMLDLTRLPGQQVNSA